MNRILKMVRDRLKSRGLEMSNIPAYVRDLVNTIEAKGLSDLAAINRNMELLGWNEIDLDDQTLQLILISLDEKDGRALGIDRMGSPEGYAPEGSGSVPQA